jgi:perosamine synthetase
VLRAALAELDEVFVLDGGGGDFEHSHYCVAAVLNDLTAQRRPEIIAHLNASGVGTSVYYPKAVPHMSYYKDKYKTPAGAFPNASRISDQSISFTVGPHVDEEDMRYTADVLKEAIMRNSA